MRKILFRGWCKDGMAHRIKKLGGTDVKLEEL